MRKKILLFALLIIASAIVIQPVKAVTQIRTVTGKVAGVTVFTTTDVISYQYSGNKLVFVNCAQNSNYTYPGYAKNGGVTYVKNAYSAYVNSKYFTGSGVSILGQFIGSGSSSTRVYRIDKNSFYVAS